MNVVGIWDGHNASACVVQDGVVVAALAEERITRRKMQRGFPHQALDEVLRLAAVSPSQVDAVAIAGAYGRLPMRAMGRRFASRPPGKGPMGLSERAMRHYENIMAGIPGLRAAESGISALLLRARLREHGFPDAVALHLVLHHRAHACAAASMVPAPNADVVTMDGYGDGLCAASWLLDNGRVSLASSRSYLSSAAVTYGSVCQLLGYREGEEGKVTALAAAGDPGRLSGFFLGKLGAGDAGRSGGPLGPRECRNLSRHSPEDVAAGVQAAVEAVVVDDLGRAVAGEGKRSCRLALAGGLFANVALNRRIVEAQLADWVQVFPAMGDDGLSVGAAAAAWQDHTGSLPRFLGPLLGTPVERDDAAEALSAAGLEFHAPGAPELAVAVLLSRGLFCAVVAGADEFGPRALGNRSLLFPADRRDLADRCQSLLRRDTVMPFAPVVAAERAAALFPTGHPCPDQDDLGLGLMTFAVPAGPGVAARYPAAVHVDGTARVQVVTREANPGFHAILQEHTTIAARSLLINTSFNLHGEPIVHGCADAVRTFVESGIDALLLGPFLALRAGSGGVA